MSSETFSVSAIRDFVRVAGTSLVQRKQCTGDATECLPAGMATYTFAERISRGEPITVHGQRMVGDFLWGDDAAHAVVLAAEDERPFRATPLADGARGQLAEAPWRVLNVATGRPVQLMDMIRLVEAAVGREAKLNMIDALAAEVHENRMDVDELDRTFGFRPKVMVEEGVPRPLAGTSTTSVVREIDTHDRTSPSLRWPDRRRLGRTTHGSTSCSPAVLHDRRHGIWWLNTDGSRTSI